MASQPETLKFGPQWIRKLSDCAITNQKGSVDVAVSSSAENETIMSEDPLVCTHISAIQESTEGSAADKMGTDVWDPVDSLRKSPQNDGRPICRPETKKDDNRGSHSRTSQFSAYNNYDASLECDRGQQYDPHPNSSFWSKSTESLSAPEFRWRRNPPANLPHPVGFSPSGLGWKKSANRTIPPVTSERLANVSRTQINESSSSCEQNSSLNQQLATKHSRAENAGSSLSPSTGQDPNVTGDSGGNSELRSSLQTSSPITPASLSSSFGGTHSKRTVSAYYGVQTTNKASPRGTLCFAQLRFPTDWVCGLLYRTG